MSFLKKRIPALVLALMILTGLMPAASANSWGLKSQTLLDFVSKSHDWDDYTAITEFRKSGVSLAAAVMGSRYHNILMVGRKEKNGKGRVWLSTTAVYQPELGGVKPKLACTEDSVTLTYPGIDQEFVFTWDESWDDSKYGAGAFVLTEATMGDVRLKLDQEENIYWTEELFRWTADPVRLEEFSIVCFPDSSEQIREMNRAYSLLKKASGFWKEQRSTKKDVKLPVYSATDTASFRAANGKASVNLKGGVTLMATLNGWDLVEYEVSQRTHRTGWIEGGHLGDPAPISLTDLPADGAVFLTDDPLWSQYRTVEGLELKDIHLLALLNPFYAYAKAVTTGGETVWGFVPLKLIQLPMEKVDEQAMADLSGTWVFYSGGELLREVLRLKADGTCEMLDLREDLSGTLDWMGGPFTADMTEDRLGGGNNRPTWKVTNSIDNGGCEKTLAISTSDGADIRLGIYSTGMNEEAGAECLTLVYGEAGGTWVRVTEK